MGVFMITAYGLAQIGGNKIMAASIFAAGISGFLYAKKNILKTARKNL
jgi:hypothetical protein